MILSGRWSGPCAWWKPRGILVNASGGVAVGTEKAWQYATKNNVGKLLIVNQMDREHADFDKVFAQLREMFGASVVAILLPIGKGESFKGLVNVLENKAYDCTTKVPKEIPIPADMEASIASALEVITDAAAGADDELMMKYLEGEALTQEELLMGFSAGMAKGEISPVVPCSAVTFGWRNQAVGCYRRFPTLSGKQCLRGERSQIGRRYYPQVR